MRNLSLLLLSVLSILNFSVDAASQEQACVSYQRADYSWSHNYKVTGFILTGYELSNFAIQKGYYSGYNSYSKYFVIPWDNGGYSALEIPYYGSSLPYYAQQMRDQENRTWKVERGWSSCY